MSAGPYFDRSGDREHARPLYSPAGDLDELERLAWAANDRATLSVLALAEDAAGLAAEEVRERNLETRDSVKRLRTTVRELTELKAANDERARQLSIQRDLTLAVRFVLSPYTGHAAKPAPKWAQYLIDTLARLDRKVTPWTT